MFFVKLLRVCYVLLLEIYVIGLSVVFSKYKYFDCVLGGFGWGGAGVG